MTFQKGNKLGGRTKGARNKSTLLKEERRAVFDAEVEKMFINKIREARPEYLLDQFLGKAPDKIEFEDKTEHNEDEEALKEAAEVYARSVVKRKTG